MKIPPRPIDLIFTRDFTLATCEYWDKLLAESLVPRFGKGISHQIMRFNGQALEVYRVRSESAAVWDRVIRQGPDAPLFSAASARALAKTIHAVYTLIRRLRSLPIRAYPKRHLELLKIWQELYPPYMLANFLPGPWRTAFVRAYPRRARPILTRWMRARHRAEGSFEAIDIFWRESIGRLLRQHKLPVAYRRVVRLHEFEQLARGGKPPSEQTLRRRLEGFIFYRGKLTVGQDFRRFLGSHGYKYDGFTATAQTASVRGQVAQRGGRIRGVVQCVMNADAIAVFRRGRVLVTTMTAPECLPAMRKAAAIITDEGGITCHAAIVSRELGIPCIIGTKIATQVLKDGDRVEVDATRGVVKKITNT